jgi:hypothetical protein
MSVIFGNNLLYFINSVGMGYNPWILKKIRGWFFLRSFPLKCCLFSFINPRLGRCKK